MGAESFKERFFEALRIGSKMMGIRLSGEATGLFFLYAERLLEENERTNLTAITGAKEVAVKHFLDALSAVQADEPLDGDWTDVGTGAGFPGVPIKLYHPPTKMLLLDASEKRVRFLSESIVQLGLSGVRAEHGRAEDAGRDGQYRERFRGVMARAVARLDVLAELCLPLVRPGGMMIAWKGPGTDKELEEGREAIRELGGTEIRVHAYSLPFDMGERRLVIVTKGESTPEEYPRRVGIPGRRPLGSRK